MRSCFDEKRSGTGKLYGIRLQLLGWRLIGRALTENVAEPAYGQNESCSQDTRAVSSTDLNNLHGPWFGKRIAQRNVLARRR